MSRQDRTENPSGAPTRVHEGSAPTRSTESLRAESKRALRRRAEETVLGKRCVVPESMEGLSAEKAQGLFEELQVHQIELELQNEELRRSRTELEISRARYFDLFDLAPVGYVSLSERGLVLEANLTLCGFLGVTRSGLIGYGVSRFIHSLDQPTYHRCRKELFETGAPQVCKLRLHRKDEALFWGRMDMTMARDGDSGEIVCRAIIADVTEVERAESMLRESELRFRALIENSGEAILLTAPDGRVLAANPEASRIFERSEAEICALGLPGLVDPEDPRLPAALAERGRTGRFKGELDCLRKDGTVFPCEVTSTLFRGSSGQMRSSMIIRDITERKQLEDAQLFLLECGRLHANESFFKSLARYLAQTLGMDFVCIDRLEGDGLTAHTVAAYFDGKFEDNVSYTLKDTPCGDVVGETICCFPQQVRHLFPRDAVLQEMMAESYVGVTLWSFDRKAIGLIAVIGRQPLQHTARAESLLKLVAVSAAAELERTQAEENLREARDNLENLINHANAPIIVWDPLFRITRFNRAFESLTGRAGRDVIGSHIEILFPPDLAQRSMQLIEDTLTGKRLETIEIDILHIDGSIHTVLWNSATLLSPDGKNPVATIAQGQDITERKRMEAEKAKLEEQFHQAQRMESVGRLAGGVAHDLNNLLSPILGYGEMLLDEFSEGDGRLELVEPIIQAAKSARDVVRQLLAFSRKQIMEFRPLNLNEVLAAFLRLLRRTIREDIAIEILPAPSLPAIRGDIGQLEQVIMNLAVNAQDAMPDGGNLTLETAVLELDTAVPMHTHLKEGGLGPCDVLAPGSYAVLTVSDVGHGMTPETQSRLFEPFFTTKEKGKGTGLGLATTYGIVKQHGGNIRVLSDVGKGTTFTIYFPVDESTDRSKSAKQSGSPKALGGADTILLVEDDPVVRQMAESILRRKGYTVLVAGDGHAALSIFDSHQGQVHLLLTDVIMPGMNGEDLFARAVARFPDLRVLYMSGYTDDAIAHRGVLDEGVAFLQKPFSVQVLASKVREVLDG